MIDHYGSKARLKFRKDCLRQPNKITYDYGHKVNVYMFMNLVLLVLAVVILHTKNCLFGAVTLTNNTYIEKYGYSGFGIGFDRRSRFLVVDLVKMY